TMPAPVVLLSLCAALGLPDRGIFCDLDARVTLLPPPGRGEMTAIVDDVHGLFVVYEDGVARKAYPMPPRPEDAAEMGPFTARTKVRHLGRGETPPGGDRDGDGIPDALDIAIGAKKVALNGAKYGGDYVSIPFPGGDLPRDQGVCTDVVIRALRNAGIDLQQ